ncbi:MAG: MazG nucleotide pyrophosphohydrolase domain-containing protein [Nitrososphaerales archaeon]
MNQDKVAEFHRVFKVDNGPRTSQTYSACCIFRAALIVEEAHELAVALRSAEITEIVKETGDLLYVVYGTAVSLGFDADLALARIHESNMSKLSMDGYPLKRADGKILKGRFYQEPDLDFLKNYSYWGDQ